MNISPLKSLLVPGLLAVTLLPAAAEPVSAEGVLRQMSATLAAAHTFSFSATREIDGALLGVEDIPLKAHVDALVERPNKFAATATGRRGERQFFADGRTLTIYDGKNNFYATLPMPATLDLLVDKLDEQYGFVPPLAEFTLSNPYREFRNEADTIGYLGREKIGSGFLGLGGVECDHIALTGPDADAELWIGVKDHLPRQLVATFKNLPEKPRLHVNFTRWNLAATATAADFTFTPPKGSMKIEMWTVEKMETAQKR